MSCTTIPFDREVTSVPHAVNADHATSASSAANASLADKARFLDINSSYFERTITAPDSVTLPYGGVTSTQSLDITYSGYVPVFVGLITTGVGFSGQANMWIEHYVANTLQENDVWFHSPETSETPNRYILKYNLFNIFSQDLTGTPKFMVLYIRNNES